MWPFRKPSSITENTVSQARGFFASKLMLIEDMQELQEEDREFLKELARAALVEDAAKYVSQRTG